MKASTIYRKGTAADFTLSLEKIARILSSRYGIKVVFRGTECLREGNLIVLPVIPERAEDAFLNAVAGFLDRQVSCIIYSDEKVYENIESSVEQLLFERLEVSRVEAIMRKLWPGCGANFRRADLWTMGKLLKDYWVDFPLISKWIIACGMEANKDSYVKDWFMGEVLPLDLKLQGLLYKARPTISKVHKAKDAQEVLDLSREILDFLDDDFKKLGVETKEVEPDIIDTPTLIEDEVQKLGDKADGEYLVYTTEGDVVEQVRSFSRADYAKVLDESLSTVGAVSNRLHIFLKTKSQSYCVGEQRTGDLDSTRLHHLLLGTSDKIFTKEFEGDTLDTAVGLAIDHSSSMEHKLILAMQTTVILGEVLNSLRIPFEVVGYSTTDYGTGGIRYESASKEEQQLYSRWGNLWIGEYKRFDESWVDSRYRVATMPHQCKFNTYDGESVRLLATRLSQRSEKRKVLFVLNDGEPFPNVQSKTSQHERYLKEVNDAVLKAGIELLAIGIYSTSVRSFYSHAFPLNNINDLPREVISRLDMLLREGGTLSAAKKMAG